MSRRQKAEMDFGSDSFLDIIANIVGILIILIVIAGVRVSQQAAKVSEPEAEGQFTRPLPDAEPVYVPPAPLPPLLPEVEPLLTDAEPLDPKITAAILAASEPEKSAPPKPKTPPRDAGLYSQSVPKPIDPSQELLASIAESENGDPKPRSKIAAIGRAPPAVAEMESRIGRASGHRAENAAKWLGVSPRPRTAGCRI